MSYSCTNNISKIIDNHKKLINKLDWNNNDDLKHSCNCKIKNECPVGNKCNLNNIIYQANISTKENDTNDKAYIGMTSLDWKFRYYNYWPKCVECSPMVGESFNPGQVIPKTQKMVLGATLLNTQHYKIRIKGKVKQSRERSSALPYTAV